jgi:hypothetical protein
MSRPDTDTDRAERRDRYEAVLRTVDLNTTEMQSPGAPEHEIVLILAGHGSYTGDEIRSSLQAAVENDDLLRWTGPEGRARYTCVAEANVARLIHYGIDELQPPVDTLRDLVALLAEDLDPSAETLGEVNRRVQEYAREGE